MFRVSIIMLGALGASLVGALPSAAATVSIAYDSFDLGAPDAARAAYEAHVAGAAWRKAEDFESFPSWDGRNGTENSVATAAGTIAGVSPRPGSGRTAINGGEGLEVRDTALHSAADFTAKWGRQNMSAGGKNWLDSNDLKQMVWTIDADSGFGKFDRLSYFLTDVGDIRGTDFTVTVSAGGTEATTHITRQANGTINLVRILLDGFVDKATVTMTSNVNDGFGIDDLTVAQVAPIPLPATGLLLCAGIGGLIAAGRMRATRAA